MLLRLEGRGVLITGYRLSFILVLTFLLSFSFALAANPGHSASSISAGTFEVGNFTFPDSVFLTSTSHALEVNGSICFDGDCITSWSGASGNATNLTVSGDSGSTTLTDGDTLSVLGGSGIETSVSGSTLTASVTAGSIGDTQLAYNTGQALTTASSPTFSDLTLSTGNITLGYKAGFSNSGARQIALGVNSGYENSGDDQVALGYDAGRSNFGNNTVVLGYEAGMSNSGDFQIALGYHAGFENGGNNTVFLGYEAGLSNTLSDRLIVKQNTVNVVPLLYGDFATGRLGVNNLDTTPDYAVDVNGSVNADSSLCIAGSCIASWDGVNSSSQLNESEVEAYIFDADNTGNLTTSGTLNATNFYADIDGVIIGNDVSAPGVTDNRVAIGYQAGKSNSGSDQTAVGDQAGKSNSGSSQTALGFMAGWTNSGNAQTAVGYWSGRSNTGNFTTSAGYSSAYQNTGDNVVALGYRAGYKNTADSFVVVGRNAGYQNSGASSVAIGKNAGYKNGADNLVALGYYAASLNNGSNVVALGYEAARDNNGSTVVALGYRAGKTNVGNNVIALGYQAGQNNVANSQFIVQQANINAVPLIQGNFSSGRLGINTASGNVAGTLDVNGTLCIAGDCKSSWASISGDATNLTVTSDSGSTNLTDGDTLSVLGGSGIETSVSGSTLTASVTAGSIGDTQLAYNTGQALTNTSSPTFSGLVLNNDEIALGNGSSSAGLQTVSIGKDSGSTNSSAVYQVALGSSAGYDNSGTIQVALGLQAGKFNSGNLQVALGYAAGQSNEGANQVALGNLAGATNTGDYQVALGYAAGESNSGDNVIALGYQAGQNNVANSQFIVQQANINAVPLIQGNFSSGRLGINTASGNVAGTLDVNGTLCIAGSCIASWDSVNSSSTETDPVWSSNYSAATGSGSVVLSASPTLTGTLNAATVTASGIITGSHFVADANDILIGDSAGNASTNYQLALGRLAGSLSSGDYQITLGDSAGYKNSADYQVALGNLAGQSNTGSHQVALGFHAGFANEGLYQVALGLYAGKTNNGSSQVALGYAAGQNNSGTYQVALGYQAAQNNVGNNLIALGYGAGNNNTADSQFIVQQANINAVPLIQGNFTSGWVGIGTTTPTANLEISDGTSAVTIATNNYNNSPTINTTNSKDLVLTSGSGNVVIVIG